MASGTFLPPGLSRSIVKIESGGTDNYVMTAVDGETIQGEQYLTFDGSTLTVNGAAVFNDSGADVDFRIESNNDANMFVVDGGTDTISVGAAASASNVFNISGDKTASRRLVVQGELTLPSGNGANGEQFRASGTIVTAGDSTGYATIATARIHEPDITKSGSDTITNSAALYIPGAATEANNDYAIFVDAGLSRFDGGLDMAGSTILNVGASGNDWTQNDLTLSGGTGAQTLMVKCTGTGANALLKLEVAASSTADPDIYFTQGDGSGSANNMQYILGYDASAGYLRVRSADMDGSSTDNDIWRIPDEGELMLLTANHGTNFDYVCDSCGRAEIELFECCGTVAWHDDVLALREMALNREGLEHMAKLGVMDISTNDDGVEWIGLNLQGAQHFTWSAMHQMYERINELETKLEALGV